MFSFDYYRIVPTSIVNYLFYHPILVSALFRRNFEYSKVLASGFTFFEELRSSPASLRGRTEILPSPASLRKLAGEEKTTLHLFFFYYIRKRADLNHQVLNTIFSKYLALPIATFPAFYYYSVTYVFFVVPLTLFFFFIPNGKKRHKINVNYKINVNNRIS